MAFQIDRRIMVEQSHRPNRAFGPLGRILTADDLPPADVKRWIAHRKAIIVSAVRDGLIALEQVATRYGITHEEFLSWERLLDDHGLRGLRATHQQKYRQTEPGPCCGRADPPAERTE